MASNPNQAFKDREYIGKGLVGATGKQQEALTYLMAKLNMGWARLTTRALGYYRTRYDTTYKEAAKILLFKG